jgi:8-oxo-dGTP pyrophosphatase MutT (NUDIX family)
MIKQIWLLMGQVVFWVGWPLLWLSLRWSTRTRVIIIDPNNHVLLVKGWIGRNAWILPGGGLHHREEEIKGAIREVYEETGVKLDKTVLKYEDNGIAHEYGLRFRYILLSASLTDSPIIKRQKIEITDITWMPLNDLKDLSPLTANLLAPWTVN